MKLIGFFKYLERKRTLTLAVILTLSSMLFSLRVLSLLGFYRGFTAYLGEGGDIVHAQVKSSFQASHPEL